ncbi:MAG TPA: cyclic lactone autoinducer peptide [Firmicutes bacterium]|nr:cyclic lactone autoinducer peptide [Bacillota bacterium]HBS93929.1 cyclic lactone autoinducer peptide [Bacillota bacterium]
MNSLAKFIGKAMLGVGTIGLNTSMCIAFFYTPKKPATLK